MTRVQDPAFVERLSGLTDTIHAHEGKIFLQLAHGGLWSRADCDRYPGADGRVPAADMVGMARPFYAEPRLGACLLARRRWFASRHVSSNLVPTREITAETTNTSPRFELLTIISPPRTSANQVL